MPIYHKNHRNSWYDSIPIEGQKAKEEYNPFLDPHFDVDKLKQNEIRQSNGAILAKIPKIETRIYRRVSTERNQVYIDFVKDRFTDPKTGKTVTQKVIIGTDISSLLPGMMYVHDAYYDYFNTEGKLIYDPMQKRKEREKREERKKTLQEAEAAETEPKQPETSETEATSTTEETNILATTNTTATNIPKATIVNDINCFTK